VILHYDERSLCWSLIIFPYLSFTTVWGQKNRFQQLWKYNFLNIANFHTLHICVKRILSCNEKTFFLCICSFSFFCNSTFFHSGYVIKDPLTRSTPTELRLLQATVYTNYLVSLLPAMLKQSKYCLSLSQNMR